ncbi:3-beta-hydroxysteroid sulfotransferase-like isoform X2 [Ptychodera flava]
MIKEVDKIRGIKSILSCIEFSSPETGEPNHAELSEKLRNHDLPMGMSTYLRESMAPEGLIQSKHKVIFVVRNPKDVCIAQLKSLLSEKDLRTRTDVGRYVDQFIEGNVPFGSWFEHTLSWWKYKNESNVMLLTYEELFSDLQATVEKIAKFVGIKLSSDYVEYICKKCCMNKMSCNGYDPEEKHDDFWDTINDGPVGEWKDYFTVSQSDKFDLKFRSRFVGTGLEELIPMN